MARKIFSGECKKCGYTALFGVSNTDQTTEKFIVLHAHFNNEELIKQGSGTHPRTPCKHAKFY